jgi:hypothetical protein
MKELSNSLKPLSMSLTESEYSRFITLTQSLIAQFKFNCIDFDKTPELRYYINPCLDYINKHLVLKETDDVLEKIDEFVELMDHINEAIIEKDCDVICTDIDFPIDKFDLVYFTYFWTSLTTNMLVRLKYNYGWVRKEKSTGSVQCGCKCTDCPCCSTCPCCCNVNNELLSYRPIQESYYTKWTSDDSYLERW